jgi:hypothetical protein
MAHQIMEEIFQEHHANCDEYGYHPDGCFYCGGDHPSSCCVDPERELFSFITSENQDVFEDDLVLDQRLVDCIMEILDNNYDYDDFLIEPVDEMYADYSYLG